MSTRQPLFGSLPQVDGNDQLERESISRLQSVLPADRFIYRGERESDKGVDGSLEALMVGAATNLRSHVQLKGTMDDKLNADGSYSRTVKASNLNYMLTGPSPLYIIWLPALNQLRYVFAREEARRLNQENPSWHEQDSVTLRFSKLLDSDGWDDIHRQMVQEGRLHRKQHDSLVQTGACGDVSFTVNQETLTIRTPDETFRIIMEGGFAAVSAGYAKEVIRHSMILSPSQLSEPVVQLVLGYAHYLLGHFFLARGHLGNAEIQTEHFSDMDLHLLRSLRSTCDYQIGRISYSEWEEQQKEIETKAPEYFRRQICLERVRWSHLNTQDDEQRLELFKELLELADAIGADKNSTMSMKLHAEAVRLHAECTESNAALIHAVFAFFISGKTQAPPFTPRTIANYESAIASMQGLYKKSENLLQRTIANKHPVHIAAALHVKLFVHIMYKANSILIQLSLTKSRDEIPPQEFESIRDDIQSLHDLFQQADDTDGVVRSMMLLANWYDINDKRKEAVATARKIHQAARALGYTRHLAPAEDHINGTTLYRQTVSEKGDPQDRSIERWAETTDEIMLDYAKIYQSMHFLPKDRIGNMVSSMKGIRSMSLEKVSWCQHLELHSDLTHLASPATRHAKAPDWTGYCSLFKHRRHTPLPVIGDAIAKFKDVYCSTCDRRCPRKKS